MVRHARKDITACRGAAGCTLVVLRKTGHNRYNKIFSLLTPALLITYTPWLINLLPSFWDPRRYTEGGMKILRLYFAMGLLAAGAAAAPVLTTIQDVLYKANGVRFNGSLVISWNGFQAADDSTVVTQTTTVKVVDGQLKNPVSTVHQRHAVAHLLGRLLQRWPRAFHRDVVCPLQRYAIEN